MLVLFRFFRDERAATTIEYAVVGAMVSILCLAGAQMIGVNLNNKFLGPLSGGFH